MNKKLIFVLIFTMFLVGISCVSAENIGDISDLSSSDVADDVISVDDSLDDEYVSISDADDNVVSADDSLDDALSTEENEILSDSGSADVYNWTALSDEVRNDTGVGIVNIKANLTPGSQIFINRSVTIVGSDDTYIGGSSSSDIVNYQDILFFTDKEGISVTLKNIKFQNCRGNIVVKFAGNGNYVLENCTFENITTPNYRNVIVHLNWGNLNITHCTFTKCSTSFGTVSNFKSDAEPNAVHMVVRDTIFKDNEASAEPGAINNCGQLEVYNSTFENNKAAWWAGAIHTHSNANTTIFDSTFENNFANWQGGALTTYSYLKVVNSNFTHNIAVGNQGGGAIYGVNQGSTPYIIVENCDFANNTASSGNGGAIGISSGILIVSDSRFENNTASSNGGAISSGISTSTIINSNFTNNHAGNMGGAIFAANKGSMNVTDCIFDVYNNASEGKAITYYFTGAQENQAFLIIVNNDFTNLSESDAVIAYPNVNVTAINNTYGNHTPENDTGEVVVIPDGATLGTVVWNMTFDGVDTLTGNPVIMRNLLIIPANHTLYCFDITSGHHIPVWNITSGVGCFGGLYVTESIVYAPCAGDQLYILDLATGNSLTSTPILEGSSQFDPVMYGTNLYISSENGYGPNNDAWITVVDGGFNYVGNILQLYNVTDYTHALLSKPIIRGNYLYVNTIWGLIRYDFSNNSTINITGVIGSPVMDENGNILVLMNVSGSTWICRLNSDLEIVDHGEVSGNCTQLIIGGNTVFAINETGYIFRANYYNLNEVEVSEFNVNPASTMTYYNGRLYIADSEGILWVLNAYDLDDLSESLIWAFNATYPLVDYILVNSDDFVCIGNNEGQFFILKGGQAI